METLYCEFGAHSWQRPVTVGRKPRRCPEHVREHRNAYHRARYLPSPRPLPAHGTEHRYKKHGCRCSECTAANTEAMRRYNARLRERGELDTWERRRARYGRFAISHADRRAIYERDDYRCQICDRPIARGVEWRHDLSPTLDHIIPRSQGGSDGPENLRTAHRLCNSMRGDGRRTDEQVREAVTA